MHDIPSGNYTKLTESGGAPNWANQKRRKTLPRRASFVEPSRLLCSQQSSDSLVGGAYFEYSDGDRPNSSRKQLVK